MTDPFFHLLRRTLERQNVSLSLLNSILNLECSISHQISGFCEINLFPSTELATIRKEVKAFKEQQETLLSAASAHAAPQAKGIAEAVSEANGGHTERLLTTRDRDIDSAGYEDLLRVLDMEHKLSERKLSILTARRKEEDEHRAVVMKKMARAKAMEEMAAEQSKDPANFRNQRF